MPLDLLRRETMYFLSSGFGIEPKVHAKTGGGKIFEGVPVFRSGSFADSRGIRNNWEDLHLRQMVENTNHLSNKGILQGVPARDGHPDFLVGGMRGKGEVVGWHLGIKTEVRKSPVDGVEYTYLLADYEVTAPYALEKIHNKLWRSRSAEIAPYYTNDESEYWPVYLGFAFVDFGAVEGLNFSMSQGNRSFIVFGENPLKERIVSDQNNTQVPSPLLFGVQQPVTPAASVAPVAQPQPQFVFSCNGQNVTDFNQVQTYIRQLETVVTETRAVGRTQFVAGLVSANKLTAAQKDGMTAFALSLSDSQYTDWMKQWDSTPVMSVLSVHGSGSTNPNNAAEAGKDTKVEDAKQIVAMHRLNGMPPAALKETGSYKVLVAAGVETA